MVGQLILGLSILIILHELGHFLAARAFGIRVEKFYLFFDAWNVSLFKFTYKGVEYGIGWLPLGGYVKIAGMIDESMDTDQLAGPPQPWEFPWWVSCSRHCSSALRRNGFPQARSMTLKLGKRSGFPSWIPRHCRGRGLPPKALLG